MANNTVLNPGTSGDTIRDVDRSGVKTQVVGIDVAIGSGAESLMSSTNGLPVSDVGRTPTTTGVAAVATSAILLVANPARKGLRIYNDSSSAVLYVGDDSAATAVSIARKVSTTTGYSFVVQPGQLWEAQPGQVPVTAILGIWAAATGFAQVTELV